VIVEGEKDIPKNMNWQVYMILCADGSLYTGMTTDCERRFRQHADGRGAKYLKGRSPLCLVYRESGHDRSSAGRREWAIKAMSRAEKERLLFSDRNEIASAGLPAGK
jgi:putative endonuclease